MALLGTWLTFGLFSPITALLFFDKGEGSAEPCDALFQLSQMMLTLLLWLAGGVVLAFILKLLVGRVPSWAYFALGLGLIVAWTVFVGALALTFGPFSGC